MATIPILEVISFSHEHSIHKVSNLMKGAGKWTTPMRNISAKKGQEITELEAEFRLPPCYIEALEIGNYWTAIFEIEVGRSGESLSSRKPLLKNSSVLFMNKMECRSGFGNGNTGNKFEKMMFYKKDDINPEVLDSSKPWDRIKIICKQPHNHDTYFGLSTLKIRGRRLDSSPIVLNEKIDNFPEHKNQETVKLDRNNPDWMHPGSRASKLMEKSAKTNQTKDRGLFKFKHFKDEKENKAQTVSPLRKKLREEDDLNCPLESKTSKNSRNDILTHDAVKPNNSPNEKSKMKRQKINKVQSDSKKIKLDDNSQYESDLQQPSTSKNSKVSRVKNFTFFPKTSTPTPSSKTIKNTSIDIQSKEDLMKYSIDQLRNKGVLIREKAFTKSKSLPLRDKTELMVDAGQKLFFYKIGRHIFMKTLGTIYEPFVEPEHVSGIFKNYSETEIFASDLLEFTPNKTLKTTEIPRTLMLSRSISPIQVETDENIVIQSKNKTPKTTESPRTLTVSSFVESPIQTEAEENIVIQSKEDLLKYSIEQLKSKGVLVEEKTFKKPRSLPLQNKTEKLVGAGEKVVFYKLGLYIYMKISEEIYEPEIADPTYITGIFRKYTADEITASDFVEFTPIKKQKQKPEKKPKKEDPKVPFINHVPPKPMGTCPMCDNTFPLKGIY